ncbi:PREDICTED: UBX domain-containing protein 11 isoform X1 [Gavialis gangeticus]|uniref:UBX domain-containing protein 11 isoform X1 n=1 Tax=Gavialis gangeticus TaxID=94835 RepID=UPI00092F734D|nr:PREDICTED: UBX domain-containing protein 11 isoform X1 [Gavialis gangeticus]
MVSLSCIQALCYSPSHPAARRCHLAFVPRALEQTELQAMTSPLSSLGKHRRVPLQLQSPGKKPEPAKQSACSEDEATLLNDILPPRTNDALPSESPSCSKGRAKASKHGEAPTDMELMSTMMQKIIKLEQKVRSQAQELQLKDRKIADLQGKVKILQKGKEDSPEPSQVEKLEVMCLQLQHQVWEMEQFLNDYGLIWVGERNEELEDLESSGKKASWPLRVFWKPGDSTGPKPLIDFDLILENLKDLNVLAGEGVSQIQHTAGGARLREPESVSLTLYKNGIVMFNGPFRSYEEPSTQQCLRDILDGYFPSELQARYPAGVPFQVTDKRDIFFRDRQLPESFPGQGQRVGHAKPSEVQETSEIPGPKLSLEQFLNKLPRSVIRDGHVIDVRGSIKATLQGSKRSRGSDVILVETPALTAAKERLKAADPDQPPAPGVCTLRVRSESGEQSYLVKMLFTETIGDLRRHLTQSRHGSSSSYEIISTFPPRVYTDDALTLQQCGLTPAASLLLRESSPGSQARQGCS